MDGARELIRLQEIDLELMRLRKQVEELPYTAQITRLRKQQKQVAAELTRLVGARKDLELEIADLASERQQVSDAVDAAQKKAEEGSRDFRAIRDLEGQLTTYAKRLEKIDFDTRNKQAELEQARMREAQAQAWIEQAKAEETKLLEAYKGELGATKEKMDELASERADCAAALDPSLLEAYSAAAQKFGGLAVETLTDTKPSICRVALSPGQIQELRQETGIATCPYCRRILVVA